MRRFLSWVSFVLCTQVLYYVQYYFWYFVQYIFNLSYSAGKILFWVLVFLGGSTVLGVFISIATYGPFICIKLSQIIWRSKKGLRYYIFCGYQIITCIFNFVLYNKGFLITDNRFLFFTTTFSTIIFSVAIIILSKNIVQEDGLPPTKKEILQTKLKKIEDSENRSEK